MSTKNTTLAGETPLSEFILETRGLTKEFKGFVAVSGVDLKVQKGHIHALIGPNGAGKSTLFNLLSGVLAPNAGQINAFFDIVAQISQVNTDGVLPMAHPLDAMPTMPPAGPLKIASLPAKACASVKPPEDCMNITETFSSSLSASASSSVRASGARAVILS